jgi:hypothetical protein
VPKNYQTVSTASLTHTTCRALPAGRILGSERVTKMLETPPKAARSRLKSTSLSETTLSDAVGITQPVEKPLRALFCSRLRGRIRRFRSVSALRATHTFSERVRRLANVASLASENTCSETVWKYPNSFSPKVSEYALGKGTSVGTLTPTAR